jgi:hypothetical protein
MKGQRPEDICEAMTANTDYWLGVSVPMEPELSQAARSRRSGILLVAGALGYMIAFALIARSEPEVWKAVAFGVIPLALGLGFFLDATLVRRDLHA